MLCYIFLLFIKSTFAQTFLYTINNYCFSHILALILLLFLFYFFIVIVFDQNFIIHSELLKQYIKTLVLINRYIEYYLISSVFLKSIEFDVDNQIKITFVLLIKIFVGIINELISNLNYLNL